MKIIWHKNPDQAITEKCRKLEEVKKKEGQKVYWELMREVLKTDPWFLMRVALEWGWLDEHVVGTTFLRHVSTNWGKDIGFLFPRGWGKTLPMAAVVITQIINNPHCAILEMNRTADNAKKFGILVSEYLMGNDILQQAFGTKWSPNGFLPSSLAECKQWGDSGYSLPNRRPRLDPTLLCISADAAKAGKHPDWIYIDDLTEEENNNPLGWENTERIVDGCKLLLPSTGFLAWTATRWHDSDPTGKVEQGVLQGKQGKFKMISLSCYEDDDIKRESTYPRKKRWNMDVETGYSKAMLEALRKPKEQGGLGLFFAAQMRNNPLPADMADLNIEQVNTYKKENTPRLGEVRLMGIETTGGGKPIYNGFLEWLEGMRINLPVIEITNPRERGTDKKDRIVAALQPIIESGKLYARKWMLGDKFSRDGLGYEIRRLGKATHDDILDALHNVPRYLSKGVVPDKPESPLDLYISVDLAWSEEKRSDWTVAMAVGVDSRGVYWIIDYERFQISSPTGIYQRLLAFYQKFEQTKTDRYKPRKKFPGAWR